MHSLKRCRYSRFHVLISLVLFVPPCAYYGFMAMQPVHYAFSSEYANIPCSLPQLNPFDPSIEKFFWKPDPLVCDFAPAVVTVDERNMLHINITSLKKLGIEHEAEVVCEAHGVVRQSDDYNVDFSKPTTIFKLPSQLTSDFTHVKCRTKQNQLLFDNVVHGITPKAKERPPMDRTESITKPSVLMFGLDSISRSASVRYLPKTRKYLQELGAYDFKGYMKLGDNTIPNFIPLTTGLRLDEEECPKHDQVRFDSYPFLWKNFSNRGYATMYAEDMPHLSCFNNGFKGFEHQPADHYMRPFWLALGKHDALEYKLSNIYRFLEDKGVKVKKTSVFCNQNTPNHEVLINYIKQFFLHYRGQRKFSLSFLTELAHTFINFLNYGDDSFVDFIKWLKDEGFLENTVLIMFSDHGARFEEMRNTFVGRIEARMPMLYILMPEKLKTKFPKIHESLQTNTERLVTAYDVHQTVIDVVNGAFDNPSKQYVRDRVRGISLFQPIKKDRSCRDAWIPEEFCACYKSAEVDIENDPEIHDVGRKIVQHINDMLSKHKQCKVLSLSKVLSAQQFSFGLKHVGTHHNGYSFFRFLKPETNRRRYSVSIETVPGNAYFDVSCEFSSSSDFHIIGSIDRTNKYGNQSYCVNDRVLKQYCYC